MMHSVLLVRDVLDGVAQMSSAHVIVWVAQMFVVMRVALKAVLVAAPSSFSCHAPGPFISLAKAIHAMLRRTRVCACPGVIAVTHFALGGHKSAKSTSLNHSLTMSPKLHLSLLWHPYVILWSRPMQNISDQTSYAIDLAQSALTGHEKLCAERMAAILKVQQELHEAIAGIYSILWKAVFGLISVSGGLTITLILHRPGPA
jgi:hypothetical protein